MTESRPGDIFQPGDLLNNTFRIEALLGRGGTSDVYRARNEISGRLVALKALKSEYSGNDDYLVLLKREEQVREIRHDSVVRYSENQRTSNGLVFLVMDYVEGPGLDHKMNSGGMPADELLLICKRVAEGLRATHAQNLVHRDLSPDNIILRDGDPAQAVIIDFGIAKDANPGAETIVGNEFAGKYAYAAPEQLNGQTDARSDIYSLGALLLAMYRGEKPNIGANPIEVVRIKSEPLETSGVPEPLKSLIDHMTNPDPEKRFQTIEQVLTELSADNDATVINLVPRQTKAPTTAAKAPLTTTSAAKKSRGGLIAMLFVILLALGGAGAYFSGLLDGLLGPKYPVADPFSLIVERTDTGIARAIGFVPSKEVQAEIEAQMETLSGTSDLTLATGDIGESWGADVVSVIKTLRPVENWRLTIVANRAQISGMTIDRVARTAVMTAFSGGLPGALTGNAEILQGPLIVTKAMLEPLLRSFADCGPLALQDPPPLGYGFDGNIVVTGRLAGTGSRVALFDAIRAISGDRDVAIDAEILNETLCLIESHLPNAPAGAIDIEFGFGKNSEPNPTGRYFVGENPVVDVLLPRSIDSGFVSVSVLDVSGNVFHLLPNLNRPDNSVQGLRAGNQDTLAIRVAFSLEEAANSSRLAFVIDDSSLGKSKIIVIHSAEPLFEGLRPTTESAAGYAEALENRAKQGSGLIFSLDSKILTTAKP